MAKRKSTTSPSSPRKKARLEPPTDTPSLEISTDDGASLLTLSTSSPPSPSRREKRKRTDNVPIDGPLEESDPGASVKRARTRSPAGEMKHSRKPGFEPWPEWQDDPDFVPWPSAFDDPQSEAHIFYEDEHYTKELTAEAREFRKQATLALHGYLLCECGKYHQMDGRKPWHYPGMEPELDESDGESVQPNTGSTHQGRSREPLLSPELSDDEVTNAIQIEITPVNASESSSTLSYSPASAISEASNVTITNSPATSPASSSTTAEAQVSLQRSNMKRIARKPTSQRQTRKNNKRKLERGNTDKGDKRQPRGRKSKTTSTLEEPVQSRRSSRRAAGSQMWFLGDNGKACLVTSSSR